MKILDCTLRDGGYYNDWNFSKELIENYLAVTDDLISSGKVSNKSLFIGDSEYDAKVASNFKLDFVFLSQWTDVHNWESKYKDCSFANIDELIESLHVIE